jgi:multiple antibiotic resistance protein
MPSLENPITMFLALFALYSPLAAVSSYFPIVSKLSPADQRRLAFGLFMYVSIFSMVAIWIGEPLLEVLGITTAALTVTGGIALMYVGVPLMRGISEEPPKESGSAGKAAGSGGWRSVLFMPVTFPLTVGGTTFAIMVSYRALAANRVEVIALSVAALAYAAVTGLTVYASGHLERRVTEKTRVLLEKVAGILLTAIAVSLLFSGGPRMVVETLKNMQQ